DAPPEMPKSRGMFPQLDVRGERVDAAIALAEKFLDDALRAGTDGVLVIHGHGTGALRDRLREHLRLCPGVSGIRPGTPDEGGDGVTVALLEQGRRLTAASPAWYGKRVGCSFDVPQSPRYLCAGRPARRPIRTISPAVVAAAAGAVVEAAAAGMATAARPPTDSRRAVPASSATRRQARPASTPT